VLLGAPGPIDKPDRAICNKRLRDRPEEPSPWLKKRLRDRPEEPSPWLRVCAAGGRTLFAVIHLLTDGKRHIMGSGKNERHHREEAVEMLILAAKGWRI